MSNMEDKEKLQSLDDKDVDQVSGGAVNEIKYKKLIPELELPVALEYGGPPLKCEPRVAMKYGVPSPKIPPHVIVEYGGPSPELPDTAFFENDSEKTEK